MVCDYFVSPNRRNKNDRKTFSNFDIFYLRKLLEVFRELYVGHIRGRGRCAQGGRVKVGGMLRAESSYLIHYLFRGGIAVKAGL
jgi:hypothetical protein